MQLLYDVIIGSEFKKGKTENISQKLPFEAIYVCQHTPMLIPSNVQFINHRYSNLNSLFCV